jgi:hypothetical protein
MLDYLLQPLGEIFLQFCCIAICCPDRLASAEPEAESTPLNTNTRPGIALRPIQI